MPDRMRPSSSADSEIGTALLLTAIFGVAALGALLWAGGLVSSLLAGRGVPHAAAVSGLRTLAHPRDPSRGWHTSMPGPVPYWTVTALLAIVLTGGALAVLRWWLRDQRRQRRDVRAAQGLANRSDVRTHASGSVLRDRGPVLRPSLEDPRPAQLGYRLGSSHGVDVWMSVEDSLVVLGPPRSGKGLHLVIPMILDAPGAVITTSTRPDNLAATLGKRAGPVAVFDPQGLAPAMPQTTKWSPIRGCDDPQTAMIRAGALAAGSADRTENRGFWQAQTESALRAFLHAAALDGRGAAELYRWSLDPAAAGEAVRILNASSQAAIGWAAGLDAIINGDRRTRDNSWAGIRTALSALADPRVLSAVSPPVGRNFDPAQFLAEQGTLYLLGTAAGVGAAANLVAALVEDVVEVARRTAAEQPATRLDPPLALLLDEAANYALPSLPSLISEGGGTGITTVAVLQSLAQARARWGEHEGAAIWDAASTKVILGGGTNARDLHDLAALIGERDEHIDSWSRDPRGHRSVSTSVRRVPILDTGRLRTRPFGTAIILQRATPPIAVQLRPWTTHGDAHAPRRHRSVLRRARER